MKNPIDLWVYLSASPLLWLTLTIAVWIAADAISIRCGRHPVANPVLISIVTLVSILWLSGADYTRYFEGAQFVHFVLGPATVALAVPLARHWDRVRSLLLPMGAALVGGSIVAVLSVVVMGQILGLPDEILISFLPKSATAGVAMAVSSSLGGNVSLTAVLVILTGIIGAIIVTPLMQYMKITDYAARGFAVGLTSHGIGTARAYTVSEIAGVFAGIAMALNAIATSIVVPIVASTVLQ